MPTTDPPIRIAGIRRSTATPNIEAESRMSHVPEIPAQIGQTAIVVRREKPQTISVIPTISMIVMKISISVALHKEYQNAECDHRDPDTDTHRTAFFSLPRVHSLREQFVARDEEHDDERKNENEVVEEEIRHPLQVCPLIVKKSDHHKVWPSGTGKFAHSHQCPEQKRRGKRGAVHKLGHFV